MTKNLLAIFLLVVVSACELPSSSEGPLKSYISGDTIGRIGAALEAYDQQTQNTLLSEFSDLVVSRNAFYMDLHPSPDTWDFSFLDAVVDKAVANNLSVYGPHLLWHFDDCTPMWFVERIFEEDTGKDYDFASLTREQQMEVVTVLTAHIPTTAEQAEALELLRDYVTTVVDRYAGKVAAWNVANEVINPRLLTDPEAGILRTNFWHKFVGPSYIEMAFLYARAADPNAILIINDYDVEGINDKSYGLYGLAEQLVAEHAVPDVVGLQMHTTLSGDPSPDGLRANIRRFGDLGVEVWITEMDVRLPLPANEADYSNQAQRYKEIVSICATEPACTGLFIWGVSDKDSWIQRAFPGFGDPLLWNGDFQRKPSYTAVAEALQ